MELSVPRLLFAAPNSGSGKTTVVCGVLRALLNRKLQVTAFKSGPDYIDPMFHTKVIGAKSRNLDIFLLGEANVKRLFAKNALGSDIAILEGAMGFYDGMGTGTEDSAYELAVKVKAPVVLIINAKGAAISLAATIKGFATFRPDSNIKGVILNNVSKMTYMYYKKAIEEETGIRLLGYFPHLENCGFESRHLGLITAGEIDDLEAIVERLATQAAETIDMEGLLELAATAEPLDYKPMEITPLGTTKIAVAMDKAFCFYYQDALDLLTELGAELVYFSPLKDKSLPDCQGLFLGGGYPELYAKELSANTSMLAAIKTALAAGLPCYAECGGFMYLLERFTTNEEATGPAYSWVGAIQGSTFMTRSLKRFGYVSLTAQQDNLLCKAGATINAHEFHYSDSTNNGADLRARKASGRGEWDCYHGTATLFAGYPHIHLWGNINFAESFVTACINYKG